MTIIRTAPPAAAVDIDGTLHIVRSVEAIHDGENAGLATVTAEPLGLGDRRTVTALVLLEDVRLHPVAAWAVTDAANWADDKREQQHTN
jgi:hypothetical protein